MKVKPGIFRVDNGYKTYFNVGRKNAYLGLYPILEYAQAAREAAKRALRSGERPAKLEQRFAQHPRRLDPVAVLTPSRQIDADYARANLLHAQLDPDDPAAWSNLRQLMKYNPNTGVISRLPGPEHLFLSQRAHRRYLVDATARHIDEDMTARRIPSEPRRFVRLLGNLRIPAERIAWAIGTGDTTTRRIGFHDGNAENLRLANLYPIPLDTE